MKSVGCPSIAVSASEKSEDGADRVVRPHSSAISSPVHALRFASLNDPPPDDSALRSPSTAHWLHVPSSPLYALDEPWPYSPRFFPYQAMHQGCERPIAFPHLSRPFALAPDVFSPSSPTTSDSGESGSGSSSDHHVPDAPRPARRSLRTRWAMWVGNLPLDVTHKELRTFFTMGPSKKSAHGRDSDHRRLADDLNGVVSVFPITRSGCAFVNYATPTALEQALARFNGAHFRNDLTKPLVCRTPEEEGNGLHPTTLSVASSATSSHRALADHFPKRFFVMKSLTQGDLILSVKTGLWATQRHNEFFLDQAFKTAKEVYLIFSANKSGVFFGYARMISVPRSDPSHVESPANDCRDQVGMSPRSSSMAPGVWSKSTSDGASHWGKEFGVQWVCTRALPFAYTEQVLNPWNRNRRVQVSRDGTELHPAVGQELLRIWGELAVEQ
ncbi:unnamed protein product [Mycena citricolor]|uniref:YTH domain-containing protein n=1 Tax=Mycena citricolor TaxID=2018698 RepID=A0AAD2JZJ1_9AGAR|nr:unnamed protein product [Mycena citricolor]